MDFYRIQDKVISWQRIEKYLRQALSLRSRGFAQQEVAQRLNMDRTFISRLEGLGELRKGQSIACIGFPVKNKEEILAILEREGVDYAFLLSEQERCDFIDNLSGRQILNEIMNITAIVKMHDIVICIASDERLALMEGMLDNPPITISLGPSPITEDKLVDPQHLLQILRSIKSAR